MCKWSNWIKAVVSCLVKASPPELLIEKFNLALTQYTAALHCIVPVFIYMVKYQILKNQRLSPNTCNALVLTKAKAVFLTIIVIMTLSIYLRLNLILLKNKFYIETKLNRDLRDDLLKLFSDHVAEKHVSTLLRECKSNAFFRLRNAYLLNQVCCVSQLFLERLIPCRFKSNPRLWRVLWKVFTRSGQVRGLW